MALCGSGFSYNVNVMSTREHIRGTFYGVNGTMRWNCSPRSYSSRCNMHLGSGFGGVTYPGQAYLKLRKGKEKRPPYRPAPLLQSLELCRVKSGDTEETANGESILLDEHMLKQDLQIAIEEENYAEAVKIRDTLKALQDDSKASVLSANARFYESFRKGDLAAMQTLWAKSESSCCVHPGAKGITGYDLVMESWEVVWMNYDFPLEIELKDIQVHVKGDVGYVTCMEFVKTKGTSWGAQFASNVFERIDGEWFICVHHASPVDL